MNRSHNMNIVFRLFTLSILATFCAKCAEDDPNNRELNIVYEANFKAFSLAPFGINAIVYLPDEMENSGLVAAPRVEHEPDGFKWDLFVGNNFHLRIDDWGDDDMIKFHKKELMRFSNLYNVEFLEDTDRFLYYKKNLKSDEKKEGNSNVKGELISYHCYGQHTIGGINYVFRTTDSGNQKPITEYMAKSIKSVKEIIP